MKGISRVLEVLISITLLLIVYFTLFYPWENVEKEEILKIKGVQALKCLDDSGLLANFALLNEKEKIEEALAPLLPTGLNYKVLICDSDCPNLEVHSEKVVSIFYFIPGNSTYLEPKEILLYMW